MMNIDRKLQESIGKKMLRKKSTLAVAESVTAGLLQYAFSQIPDARLFFQGGLTAYNLGQKYKHLFVEPISAEACNCVSQLVADQMATAVSKQFNSDWGIGITGYATPVPESGNKIYCYYSISYRGRRKTRRKLVHQKAEPGVVQLYYTRTILKHFVSLLTGKAGSQRR